MCRSVRRLSFPRRDLCWRTDLPWRRGRVPGLHMLSECMHAGAADSQDPSQPLCILSLFFCFPQRGEVVCARRRCPAVSCPHPALDGCACAVCDGCNFHGRGCFNGERFPHPTDRCQLCSCLVLSHTHSNLHFWDLVQRHQHLLIFRCTGTVTDYVKELSSPSVCAFVCLERCRGVHTCVLSECRLCASGNPSWRVLPRLHRDLSPSGEGVPVWLHLHFALWSLLVMLLSGQSDGS